MTHAQIESIAGDNKSGDSIPTVNPMAGLIHPPTVDDINDLLHLRYAGLSHERGEIATLDEWIKGMMLEYYDPTPHNYTIYPAVYGWGVNDWLKAGKDNVWISQAWDPAFNLESFHHCINPTELLIYILHGNWSLGQAFTLGHLCFINQVDGGDEWAVFDRGFNKSYIDPQTHEQKYKRVYQFESISLEHIANRSIEAFYQDIYDLLSATDDERHNLNYGGAWSRATHNDPFKALPFLPADTWMPINEDLYWYCLEVLPPAVHWGNAFAVGEPHGDSWTGKSTYNFVLQYGDNYYMRLLSYDKIKRENMGIFYNQIDRQEWEGFKNE